MRGLKTSGLKTALKERLKLYIQSQRESALAYLASDDAMRRQEVNLEESGSVYAVGANHQGQLGMGDTMPREVFTCIPELRGKSVDFVSAVSVQWGSFLSVLFSFPLVQSATQGADYCVAVTEDSEVYSWGGGGYAPLGHPKLKPPDDDDEMELYLAELRELV